MRTYAKNLKTGAYWSTSILLAALFLFAGGSKLIGIEMQVENFARWGIPDIFRPVVGLVEVIAAGFLLHTQTRFYGAAILAGTMVGAVVTHLTSGVDLLALPAVQLLLIISLMIAWGSRPAMLRRRSSAISEAWEEATQSPQIPEAGVITAIGGIEHGDGQMEYR